MLKLTREQAKSRERIMAWLQGKAFAETSRAKPVIPELDRDQVLNDYVPDELLYQGAYMTPLDMAQGLLSHCTRLNENGKLEILEPCAGIGNLLYHVKYSPKHKITAYELNWERFSIGKRIFPLVEWLHANPFDHYNELHSRFDVVLMNPPFNIKWEVETAEKVCQSGATISHVMFLELAIHALKPGGQAVVIAPYSYLERMAKKTVQWVTDRCTHRDLGLMPGRFKFSGIETHGWIIVRNKAHHNPNTNLQDGLSAPESVKSIVNDLAPRKNAAQAVLVPVSVYHAIKLLDPGDYLTSPTQTAQRLKDLGERDAAAWVKDNSIEYGQGFFNGFVTDGQEVFSLV